MTATRLHYAVLLRRFSVMALHIICLHFSCLLGGLVRSAMPHRAEGRTLRGRARLKPTQRHQRRDHQSEDKNGRLNAKHTVQNPTPSILFVPTVI